MVLTIEQKKERIIRLSRILIVMIIALTMLMPIAQAKKDNSGPKAWVIQIQSGVFDAINETLNGKGDKDTTIYQLVSSEDYVNHNFGDAYKVLKVIGTVWAMAIAMMKLIQCVEKGQDPMETVFKTLIEIAIVGLIIINLNTIVDIVTGLGKEIVGALKPDDGGAVSTLTPEDILRALDGDGNSEGGVIWAFKMYVFLLVPWLATWVTIVVAKFVIIQIVLEIALRKLFMPLAIADIYQEGLRSPGMRYLKRLLAVYLKLAICIAVTLIVKNLTGYIIGNLENSVGGAISYLFSLVTLNFTAVGTMFKASEVANDVVGA